MMPSVLSSRARRGQKTNSASCPQDAARCRHVSHAARIATPFGCCKPANLSAVSACRRFSGPRSPPAALVQTPSAFQVVFTEGHFRGAPQGSAEMSPLLRSGNPLRWRPGPFQQSPLRRRDPNPPPPSPQWTSAAIPTTGSVGRRPLCQSREALFLSLRGTPSVFVLRTPPGQVRNAPASCPPALQMQRCRLRRLRST